MDPARREHPRWHAQVEKCDNLVDLSVAISGLGGLRPEPEVRPCRRSGWHELLAARTGTVRKTNGVHTIAKSKYMKRAVRRDARWLSFSRQADARTFGRVGRHTKPRASHTHIHAVACWPERVLCPAFFTVDAAMGRRPKRPSANSKGPSSALANPNGPSIAPANPDDLEEELHVYVCYALSFTLCIGLVRIMQWVHVLGRLCCRRKPGSFEGPPGCSGGPLRDVAPGVRARAAGTAANKTRTR